MIYINVLTYPFIFYIIYFSGESPVANAYNVRKRWLIYYHNILLLLKHHVCVCIQLVKARNIE